MPQPKQTWLDRLLGAERRKPVPPVRPVATPEPVEGPTREAPPTDDSLSLAGAKQEPQATPPPTISPWIAAGMQRTSAEIAAIQNAAQQRGIAAEQAFRRRSYWGVRSIVQLYQPQGFWARLKCDKFTPPAGLRRLRAADSP